MTTKKTKKKPAAKKAAKKKAAPKKAAKVAKKAAKKVAKKATKKTAKKAAPKKAAKKVAKKAAKKVAKKATKKVAKKAAKKATKKATKKAAAPKTTKSSSSEPSAYGAIALPGLSKLNTAAYAPSSEKAAVTLVPDDEDDALEENLAAAFDDAFTLSSPLAKTVKIDRAKLLAFVPGDPTEDMAQACAALALEKKAEDVVILKVSDLTSYADFFVIAAAPSERQVMAIARSLTEELKKVGKGPLSTDGLDQGNWVIVDYGSVVVHVFLQSARRYYDLDGFWVDAPRVTVDEARGQGALASMT